jgi:hypothetical protein
LILLAVTGKSAVAAVQPIPVYINPEPEAVPNVARGAKARASDYLADANNPGTAVKAVDGDFGPYSTWMSSRTKNQSWIELDFSASLSFNTVRLYWTTILRLPSFKIYAGNSPNPKALIFSATTSQAAAYKNGSVYRNSLINFSPTTARYLRLKFLATDIRVDEIEVFNGAPPARSPAFEPGDTRIRLRESITPQVLAQRGDLLVWFESGAHKVFRDEVVFGAATPDPVAQLSAAQGESEPFQIVLYHPSGLANARLAVEDLSGPETIPASNVRWHSVGYVYVRTKSAGLVSQLGRTQGLGRGWYPDYVRPAEPVTVLPGKHQPLWIVVDVPRGAVAGDYTGRVTLLADGDVSIPLELKVHVYDFSLPTQRAFSAIGREDGNIYGDTAATKLYFEQLSRLGFTGPAVFWPSPNITEESGKLVFDWTQFDDMAEYCIDQLHFSSLGFPGGVFAHQQTMYSQGDLVGRSGLSPGSPEFFASLEESLTEYGSHLSAKGWEDKFVFYVADEPGSAVVPFLTQVEDVFRSHLPNTPILQIGGTVFNDQVGRVNIWGPNEKGFNIPLYAGRAAAGDRVWSYANSLWLIDTPPLTSRALGWAYSKYDISGVFFFNLDKWSPNPYEIPFNSSRANGPPLFFYRDPTGVKGKLVNSLRIEMMRDGWEDWEYIRQLRALVKNAEDAGYASHPDVLDGRAALNDADALTYQYGYPVSPPAKYDYLYDPAQLLSVRDQVARAIEKVKTLVASPPT